MVDYSKDIFVWFPRSFGKYDHKIYIDSVLIPNNQIYNFEFSRGMNDEHGDFNIQLNNNSGNYEYLGGEEVLIYMDLNGGTTKVFKGILEKPKQKYALKGINYSLTGGYHSVSLLDINATFQFTDTLAQTVMAYLFTNFAPSGFTYNSTTYPISGTISCNYSSKPFWECVLDILTRAYDSSGTRYDTYVDEDGVLVAQEHRSVLNTQDAIVGGRHPNYREINGLGYNLLNVANRIKVYGKDYKGEQILYVAEDLESQTTYKSIRELPIYDDSITTYVQAKSIGDAKLLELKTAELEGSAKTFMLPSLKPADLIWVSIPEMKLHNQYLVSKFTTKYPDFSTEVTLTRTTGTSKILKKTTDKGIALESIDNPNNLNHSYNFPFNDSTGFTLTNCVIENGFLTLETGYDTGSAVSDAYTHTSNITQAELRYNGKDLNNSTFYISVDGVSYEVLTRNTLHTIGSTGKTLYLKVVLNRDSDNTNPTSDNVTILFS